MSGRWGVAALGQNPDLSTPKRGPRFIGSVFLGSSQHPASAHCVRGFSPPIVHPQACEPPFPWPGVRDRETRADQRQPHAALPVSPPRRPLTAPRGNPGRRSTSPYGLRSPGIPEPRTPGPPSSPPSPHSPLWRPNPDPPTAAPAHHGAARLRHPAATPALKEPAPFFFKFHSAHAHQLPSRACREVTQLQRRKEGGVWGN